ncbi:MAG: hypothetical protein OEZ34_08010 [Spirochaetia bacterium]|nr:hypothetical protein [Spirochaetia bacterium]
MGKTFLLFLVFLISCGPRMVRNDEHYICTDECVKVYNSCITAAGTAEAIDDCKIKLDQCLTACEVKHPKLIEREKR